MPADNITRSYGDSSRKDSVAKAKVKAVLAKKKKYGKK